jgi:copper chaperone CopZ
MEVEGTIILTAKQSLLPILLACLAACVFGCGQQGNSQATEAREFAIEGMSCEGCVSTVTSALKAVPGVQSVEVSLKEKKGTVVANGVSSQTIEDTVAKAGYKARLITAVPPQH